MTFKMETLLINYLQVKLVRGVVLYTVSRIYVEQYNFLIYNPNGG